MDEKGLLNKNPKPDIKVTWDEQLELFNVIISDEDLRNIDVFSLKTKLEEYIRKLS